MVITRLIGGLGNQMFQYAAGKSIAVANNCSLKLDISGFDRYKLHNGYQLDLYNIDEQIASEQEVNRLVNGKTRLSRYIYKKLKLTKQSNIVEQSFIYDLRLSKIDHSVYIDGYWQSYKYLKEIESQLRQEFVPKEPLNSLNQMMANKISEINSVSIHIRRGDYVNNAVTNRAHGFIGVEYYKRSIEIIYDRVVNPFFFVFSDDIKWAKDNLGFKRNVVFVEHNQGASSYEDMRLMSLCKHHIVANSSFSWWGAWLGYNVNKIVLYPDKWFATDERDTSTLCPPEWELVKV